MYTKTLITALAGIAAAAPASPAARDTVDTISLLSLRSTTAVHLQTVTENGLKFWIHKDTATYCPPEAEPCPSKPSPISSPKISQLTTNLQLETPPYSSLLRPQTVSHSTSTFPAANRFTSHPTAHFPLRRLTVLVLEMQDWEVLSRIQLLHLRLLALWHSTARLLRLVLLLRHRMFIKFLLWGIRGLFLLLSVSGLIWDRMLGLGLVLFGSIFRWVVPVWRGNEGRNEVFCSRSVKVLD